MNKEDLKQLSTFLDAHLETDFSSYESDTFNGERQYDASWSVLGNSMGKCLLFDMTQDDWYESNIHNALYCSCIYDRIEGRFSFSLITKAKGISDLLKDLTLKFQMRIPFIREIIDDDRITILRFNGSTLEIASYSDVIRFAYFTNEEIGEML